MENNNIIIKRIQNFLYSFYAKDIKDARINEIYDGLCNALMQEIGKKWVDSKSDYKDKNVYILSFEYLPGKFLQNNIRKLNLEKDIRQALDKLDLTLEDILEVEKEASLGTGEIGVGSYYLLNELTNRKIKTIAYALGYENGNMKQVIKDGRQYEYSDYLLSESKNWEHRKGFSYEIKINGSSLRAQPYDLAILNDCGDYVNTLRLWKSIPINNINFREFSKGDLNKAYNDYIQANSITQFIYLDNSTYEGKLLRLKQEYFYAYASINDILRRYMKVNEDISKIINHVKIIGNDIHPALSIIIFINLLNSQFKLSYEKCIEFSRKIFDHIVFLVTEDSYETYHMDMIKNLDENLYETIINIDEILKNCDFNYYLLKDNYLILDNINKYLSGCYYITSKYLFTENQFEDKYDHIKQVNFGIDRIMYLENNNKKLMRAFKNFNIKSSCKTELIKISNLTDDDNFISQIDNVKLANKIDFLNKYRLRKINPFSIFDMQVGRFHEAKRQLLNALSIARIYYLLKDNCNLYIAPTTYIFSGKANEGYFIAKETIKFIIALKNMIESDRLIKDKIKIVFIEDYNVGKSLDLYKVCDVYSDLTLPKYDNNNFEILSSIFNFSNVVTSKGGIISNNLTENEFYVFDRLEDIGNYYANDFYYSNESLKLTIDNLINEKYGNFSYDFKIIYDYLINYNDVYGIFKDFDNLNELRLEVSRDYFDRNKWIRKEIKNLLWANEFDYRNNIINLLKV